jgi:hypothetical protein
MSSSPVFSRVRVVQSLVFVDMFVDRWFFFFRPENKIFEIPTIQTTQLAGSQDKFPNERKMTKSVVLFGPMIIEQNMEM